MTFKLTGHDLASVWDSPGVHVRLIYSVFFFFFFFQTIFFYSTSYVFLYFQPMAHYISFPLTFYIGMYVYSFYLPLLPFLYIPFCTMGVHLFSWGKKPNHQRIRNPDVISLTCIHIPDIAIRYSVPAFALARI